MCDNELIMSRRVNRLSIIFSVITCLLSLLTASLVGFFLPRFTSVDTYAQFRVFSLYYGYLGFFHFGFIDGVCLKYGGIDFLNLPKKRFRMYSRFLFIFQFFIQSMFGLVIIVCFGKNAYKSPIFLAFMCLVLCAFNDYFAFIDQFTKRFFIDGIARVIHDSITILGFVFLVIVRDENYIHYIFVAVFSYLISLLFQIIFNKDLLFGTSDKLFLNLKDLKDTIFRGFFVMISQFMSIFVVSFDSLIVNLFMDNIDFAMYTFAISIVTFMFQLTAVISKLIFPYLKRLKEDKYPEFYENMKMYMILFSAFVMGMSFIFVIIVPIIIPNYTNSLEIIKILGVSVMFKGVQELVCGNFFKVLDIEKNYAKVNSFALIFSIISDIVAFLLFRNTLSIAIASAFTFLIWLFLSDIALRKKMNIVKSVSYYIIILIAAIYIICMILNSIVGAFIYFFVVFIFAFIIWRKYPLFNKKQ